MKLDEKDKELIKETRQMLEKSRNVKVAGEVGSILVSEKGNKYFGVSISAYCGIGTCAEPGAIAQLISNGESKIKIIVAVSQDGKTLPPCGRCREMMYQMDADNLNTDIIISDSKKVKLKELLPERWQEIYFK